LKRLAVLMAGLIVCLGLFGCGGGPEAPKLSEKLQGIADRASFAEGHSVPGIKISYYVDVAEADLLTLSKEEAVSLLKYYLAKTDKIGKYERVGKPPGAGLQGCLRRTGYC
jgi:hypothetical protein